MRTIVKTAWWCGCLGLAACSGATAEQPHGSSGPTHTNGATTATADTSDAQLRTLAAAIPGTPGDAADRPRFDLISAQVRAYVRAVVHAQRGAAGAGSTDANGGLVGHMGDTGTAGFQPSRVLLEQLSLQQACAEGEDADDCAGAIGDALVSRIELFEPATANASLKESLFAAIAPFQQRSVHLPAATRWRVLSTGTDAAARLAQAFTLVSLRQQVARAAAQHPGGAESAQQLARMASDLGMGTCAEAYARLGAGPVDDAGAHAALAAFVTGECVPACARAALAAGGEDPVGAAAAACASSTEPVAIGTFESPIEALEIFAHDAAARLAAVHDDAFVTEVLSATTPQETAMLLGPAPAFIARHAAVVLVPDVRTEQLHGPGLSEASQLVWVPAAGDLWLGPPPRVTAGWDAPAPLALVDVAPDAVAHTIHPAGDAPPIAVALDTHARAARVAPVLTALAPAASSTDAVIFGWAVRHGASTRYVPMRLVSHMPDTVFRIGEHDVAVLEHNIAARVVPLRPPAATGADDLSGAIPAGRPSGALGIAFEPDVTGATAARAIDAVVGYNARAENAAFVAMASQLADGLFVGGVGVEPSARLTELRTAIESHHDDVVRSCLANVAGEADGTPARVDLHLVVGPQGQVSGVGSTQSAALAAAGHCVARAARGWHLTGTGAAVDVHVPYFAAAGASVAPAASSASPPPAHH